MIMMMTENSTTTIKRQQQQQNKCSNILHNKPFMTTKQMTTYAANYGLQAY